MTGHGGAAGDPHGGQPVMTRGPAPRDARLAAILVHGRGAGAGDILSVAAELDLHDIAFLAPQAAGHTWYPYSFLAPIPQNEPGLTSGLGVLARLVATLSADGLDPARIALLGFSQGACLTLEFAARHAARYAGVIGFSGGLIGPPGTPRDYAGSFGRTPVFLGCSDVDPHIPLERVHESADVFRRLGAEIDTRIYPGMGHTVNDDEIRAARTILSMTGAG
jgi:predicted esterase